MPEPLRLILASTSVYRRELLGRVTGAVEAISPGIEESSQVDEQPGDMAARLARAKARAVSLRYPGAIVIGSDQVADLDGRCLGKPGNADNTLAQLVASSGRTVAFHTAVCVIAADGSLHEAIDITHARFRSLSLAEIDNYIRREQPFDCAGGFKAEALGIALFDAIQSDDPTALIGLPLIATCRLLREAGFDPLG